MERLEAADAALAAAQAGLAQAQADRERAEQLRDDALADIADAHAAARGGPRRGRRRRSPRRCWPLYDRIRAADRQHRRRDAAGPRAARAAGSSSTATSWPPSATPTRTRCVRCENCGRILVRTAESGL